MGASGTDEAAVDASGAAVAFTSGLESDRFGKVLHGIHALFLSACSVASACESAWLWRGMITARSPPPPSCFVQRQHSPNCSGGGGAIAPTPGIPASRKRVHDVMDGEASAAACEAIYRLTAAMVPCWMMALVLLLHPPHSSCSERRFSVKLTTRPSGVVAFVYATAAEALEVCRKTRRTPSCSATRCYTPGQAARGTIP